MISTDSVRNTLPYYVRAASYAHTYLRPHLRTSKRVHAANHTYRRACGKLHTLILSPQLEQPCVQRTTSSTSVRQVTHTHLISSVGAAVRAANNTYRRACDKLHTFILSPQLEQAFTWPFNRWLASAIQTRVVIHWKYLNQVVQSYH